MRRFMEVKQKGVRNYSHPRRKFAYVRCLDRGFCVALGYFRF